MNVFLVDGTYELFRHFYALPSARDENGREVGAVRGVLRSLLGMIRDGVTHLAVATDHVIESFRNEMWADYKTSAGVEPALLEQFSLLEAVIAAAGITLWPMVEFEADDALAAGAKIAAADARVDQVIICSPDKDLAQCVHGRRIVQLDRRKRVQWDEDGIRLKFGVAPSSIPDYLALIGDSADGYPGLPGWGPKSASIVLSKFGHIEQIPNNWRAWNLPLKNSKSLGSTLNSSRDHALLFRTLARLRTDITLFESVDQLEWKGPTEDFSAIGHRLDSAVTESHAKRSRPVSQIEHGARSVQNPTNSCDSK